MVVVKPFCNIEYIIILQLVYAPSAFAVSVFKMCFTLVFNTCTDKHELSSDTVQIA